MRPGRLRQNMWTWNWATPGTASGMSRADRIHERREDVVLEVATDAGQFDGDVDAEAVELVGRPDAREHQQLGGVEHAGAQDQLALGDDPLDGAGPLDLDADAAATLDEQASGRAPGADDEVRVPLGRRRGRRVRR